MSMSHHHPPIRSSHSYGSLEGARSGHFARSMLRAPEVSRSSRRSESLRNGVDASKRPRVKGLPWPGPECALVIRPFDHGGVTEVMTPRFCLFLVKSSNPKGKKWEEFKTWLVDWLRLVLLHITVSGFSGCAALNGVVNKNSWVVSPSSVSTKDNVTLIFRTFSCKQSL